MDENIVISCSHVSKAFVTLKALTNISFIIQRGESVSLVGANGAGKSTLFNILLGLLQPDEGDCSILGVAAEKITPKIRSQIGFVADHAGPVPWASSDDIARLYSSLYPKWNKQLYLDLMNAWSLDRSRRLNQLSKGQKRLAEIALIAAVQPEIIILDEPFDGLDAIMRIQIQRLLRQFQKENKVTILYATHILSELVSVADRMIILRHGNIVHDNILKEDIETPEDIFIRLYNTELTENRNEY